LDNDGLDVEVVEKTFQGILISLLDEILQDIYLAKKMEKTYKITQGESVMRKFTIVHKMVISWKHKMCWKKVRG